MFENYKFHVTLAFENESFPDEMSISLELGSSCCNTKTINWADYRNSLSLSLPAMDGVTSDS